jgi:predicted ATP-dependent endonuclease of OLD family
VDEPETYLHPTLQSAFLRLLRERHQQVFLATHSASIVATSVPGEVAVLRPGASDLTRLRVGGLDAAQVLELLPESSGERNHR